MALRVLMLSTSFPRFEGDPASPFVYGCAKGLLDKGLNVQVIAPHDSQTRGASSISGISVRRFQYFWPKSLQQLAYHGGMPANFKKSFLAKVQLPFFMLSFFFKAMGLGGSADVLHAHWIPSGIVAVLVKKIRKKPVVLYVHGATVFLGLFKPLIKFALNNSDFVFFNSTYTKEKTFAIAVPKNWAVLPPGIDLDRFNSNVKKGVARKKHGIQNSAPMIFSLGRMVERKGFDYLIKAMPFVGQKAILVLGGSGPEEESLRCLARRLGLQQRVIFAGRIAASQLPFYYADCNVFVLPAIVDKKNDTEGLGLVLAEAMACGKAVVGTKVGGIPDVIADSVNGFLVGQKNERQLAEKIELLLANKQMRQRFGAKGRLIANSRFNWGKISEKTIEVYNSLLNPR